MPARTSKRLQTRYRLRRPNIFGKLKPLFVLGLLLGVVWAGEKIVNLWQERKLTPDARLTIVIGGDKPVIFSYDPTTELFTKITLPSDLQLNTPFGYGQLQVGSLWKLGEQKGVGGEIMRLSIQKSLGLPIDGWFAPNVDSALQSTNLGWLKTPFYAWKFSSKASSFSFFDRLYVLSVMLKMNPASIQELNLVQKGVIRRQELPDGTQGFVVVGSRAKNVFEIFRDDKILAEGKTITIANSTSRDGLAAETASLLSTLGLRVLGLGNATGQLVQSACVLIGSKENLRSFTALRIKSLLDCIMREGAPSTPSNFELIIGESYP